ncbi:MAG: indole-3-glycerol phosphate synthase TrpC [Planctomycetota bacterium]
MSSILDKIIQHKLLEISEAKAKLPLDSLKDQLTDSRVPPARDFIATLTASKNPVGLIAEVKKASPSKGLIRPNFDPVDIAVCYAQSGVDCISVLTDQHFFQGSLEYLKHIRSAVEKPLLRKDFILDEYQILEARLAGADAVLLIAECLEAEKLIQLHECIVDLGMTPLVELYDVSNLDAVLACKPQLVGVNNRDLNTFEVDLYHSIRVKSKLPSDIVFVSESGIYSHDDILLMESNGVQAVLVGESLMRQTDVGSAVRELMGQ